MSEDIIGALVTFLKTSSDVTALVGDRVFGIELPGAEAASMPRKAVVLSPSGGVSLAAGSYMNHDTQRVDAFSFGETLFEADRVRRAVFDAFRVRRRGVTGTTLIHWIESAGGWVSQRDADEDWPRSWQSFQVYHALEAA